MIYHEVCPVCGQKNISFVFQAEDYTVSHEKFEIWECKDCSVRFTQNIPSVTEIGTYYQSDNYISHTDTQAGLINTLYHKVRNHTLLQKRKMVESTTGKSGGTLLDLGCGTGAFLNTMKHAGWDIKGLEPDANAREKALELYGLQAENAEKLFSLPGGTFDAITMWHVLEHVHELHEYIIKLKSLLKQEGKLFIAVPNYTSYDAGIYKEHWAAYDVPRHLYHFSPGSMEKLLDRHGLKISRVTPMWYDSFYVSMLSEQYKTGKGNLFKAAINGGLSNCKAFFDIKKCSSVVYIAGTQSLSNGLGTSPGNQSVKGILLF